jgi:hypothetical protein
LTDTSEDLLVSATIVANDKSNMLAAAIDAEMMIDAHMS